MKAQDLRTKAHTLTAYDYRNALLKLLESNPEIRFENLTPGTYWYKGHSVDYSRIARIHSLSAAKKKASMTIVGRTLAFGGETAHDEYKGSWHGPFHPIDEDTVELARAKHEDLVKAAPIKSVPGSVRREYPALFVDIPTKWTAREVSDVLNGFRRVIGPDDIKRCLESVHESIRAHDKSATNMICLATKYGQTQEESDKARASLLDRLDFYLWLLPHVSPNGVFAIDDVEKL